MLITLPRYLALINFLFQISIRAQVLQGQECWSGIWRRDLGSLKYASRNLKVMSSPRGSASSCIEAYITRPGASDQDSTGSANNRQCRWQHLTAVGRDLSHGPRISCCGLQLGTDGGERAEENQGCPVIIYQ